jgi:aldose 1-epimerase
MLTPINDPVQMLRPEDFRNTIDGKQADLFFLQNGDGLVVAVTNYGARIAAVYVRDKDGAWRDVVLGFASLAEYERDGDYHGAFVGRYANRIASGKFSLEGKEYTLATNNAPNHLHGGKKGFDRAVWQVEESVPESITLRHISPDGDEGYPGRVEVTLRYSVTKDNALRIEWEAKTDKATPVNMTNHAYFNLNGQGNGTVLDHRLAIHASAYTPVDATLIPVGELASVEGTPFDFRHPVTIGARINDKNEQLERGSGYDHNFVLDRTEEGGVLPAARAIGNESGIVLDVLTTEPGIQLYTGNFLKGDRPLKYGLSDPKNGAFCLETQHFPDSPNQPQFPATILQPGIVYDSETVFAFSVITTS